MKTKDTTNNPIELLQRLKKVPDRAPELTAQQRAEFIRQLEALPEPVSTGRYLRLKYQLGGLSAKLRTLTIVSVLIFMFFGGGMITVSASRSALPGNFLYPVKLWLEDAQITITTDPIKKLGLHLEFAEQRLQEFETQKRLGLNGSLEQLRADFHSHILEAQGLISSTEDLTSEPQKLSELLTRMIALGVDDEAEGQDEGDLLDVDHSDPDQESTLNANSSTIELEDVDLETETPLDTGAENHLPTSDPEEQEETDQPSENGDDPEHDQATGSSSEEEESESESNND